MCYNCKFPQIPFGMNKNKVFFDIHLHAFNLSHAGLLAFANRFLLSSNLSLSDFYQKKWLKISWIITKSILISAGKAAISIFQKRRKGKTGLRRIVNMLSIFENDIARQFQYLELDYLMLNPELKKIINRVKIPVNYREFSKELKTTWEKIGKKLIINQNEFSKVILTPLMMDFNYKGFDGLDKNSVHYYLPPRKQIQDQAIDLFAGIRQYYGHSRVQLFEIFPFKAINTQNLEYKEKEPIHRRSLKEVLNRSFQDFSGSDTGKKRYEKVKKKLKEFRECENPFNSDNYYFAGIKVYPPLGFDPWPESKCSEWEKVNFLYQYCVDKNIPVTTHCSDGGFIVVEKQKSLNRTSPEKWKEVLKAYPSLKLNFAHHGIRNNKINNDWTERILNMVVEYENVYFDIADNGYGDYYERLIRFILEKHPCREELKQISSRMLFGSDFMMNLRHADSYNEYLSTFSATNAFEKCEHLDKLSICTGNPFEFVFGKI